MKTIAVGPLLLTEFCVTGGATVAIQALLNPCFEHDFDTGREAESCKALLAKEGDRFAMLRDFQKKIQRWPKRMRNTR